MAATHLHVHGWQPTELSPCLTHSTPLLFLFFFFYYYFYFFLFSCLYTVFLPFLSFAPILGFAKFWFWTHFDKRRQKKKFWFWAFEYPFLSMGDTLGASMRSFLEVFTVPKVFNRLESRWRWSASQSGGLRSQDGASELAVEAEVDWQIVPWWDRELVVGIFREAIGWTGLVL